MSASAPRAATPRRTASRSGIVMAVTPCSAPGGLPRAAWTAQLRAEPCFHVRAARPPQARDRRRSLHHPVHSESRATRVCDIEADSVILDRENDPTDRRRRHSDPAVLRVGVADRVTERLLDDPQRLGLGRRRQEARLAKGRIDLHVDGHPGVRRPAPRSPPRGPSRRAATAADASRLPASPRGRGWRCCAPRFAISSASPRASGGSLGPRDVTRASSVYVSAASVCPTPSCRSRAIRRRSSCWPRRRRRLDRSPREMVRSAITATTTAMIIMRGHSARSRSAIGTPSGPSRVARIAYETTTLKAIPSRMTSSGSRTQMPRDEDDPQAVEEEVGVRELDVGREPERQARGVEDELKRPQLHERPRATGDGGHRSRRRRPVGDQRLSPLSLGAQYGSPIQLPQCPKWGVPAVAASGPARPLTPGAQPD